MTPFLCHFIHWHSLPTTTLPVILGRNDATSFSKIWKFFFTLQESSRKCSKNWHSEVDFSRRKWPQHIRCELAEGHKFVDSNCFSHICSLLLTERWWSLHASAVALLLIDPTSFNDDWMLKNSSEKLKIAAVIGLFLLSSIQSDVTRRRAIELKGAIMMTWRSSINWATPIQKKKLISSHCTVASEAVYSRLITG